EPRPAATIVIDDMGDRPLEGQRVADLTVPVVCAFLPHTPHAPRQARACHRAGKDVMLHLPMEALNGGELGPGGVTLDMTPERFRDVVEENLDAIPHVAAVNNHMGSLLTQHPGHMTWLMEILAEAGGLLFLDSRTSPDTVGKQMAREADLPALERDVFLDHYRDPEAIDRQLRLLLRQARRDGTAVGIGHPYPETLDVLEERLEELADAYGVELVGLEELYGRRNGR
ncbi:divergent polysaccharide deacetylase family protein, partial [Aquisalimonas sp.]